MRYLFKFYFLAAFMLSSSKLCAYKSEIPDIPVSTGQTAPRIYYIQERFIFIPAPAVQTTQSADLQKQLRDAVDANDVERAKSLLENGAQANEDNPCFGHTLLHSAAKHASLEMVQLLIAHGANTHAQCSFHPEQALIPLVFATHNSDPRVMDILLQTSPDINLELLCQMTEYAIEGYIVEAFRVDNLATIKSLIKYINLLVSSATRERILTIVQDYLIANLSKRGNSNDRINILWNLFAEEIEF